MFVSIFDKDLPAEAGSTESSRKEYLGGKGFGLWWMIQSGINVPPAAIFPTSYCREYLASPGLTMSKVLEALPAAKALIKEKLGYAPLLSVRSGAKDSMPGMMDTLLNVGLDVSNLDYWSEKIGKDTAEDCFKRLIVGYGSIVKGFKKADLEHETVEEALKAYRRLAGEDFPGAHEQLLNSIEAVFKSWMSERAQFYRKAHGIPEGGGTAVTLQAMVFGNKGAASCTGVVFSRDNDLGHNVLYGNFAAGQGEDVVGGIAAGKPIAELKDWSDATFAQLRNIAKTLEAHRKDVQDIEFTVEDGVLYILQTRDAKRTAPAAIKIALDMYAEGMIDKAELFKRVTPKILDAANTPMLHPSMNGVAGDFCGLGACAGAVVGEVVTSAEDAVVAAKAGKKVIMVAVETMPDDIKGIYAAVGVLTMKGGKTSHAAVVAKSINRITVVNLGIEHLGMFKPGQLVTICGSTGRVWLGERPIIGGENPDVGRFVALKIGGGALLTDRVPQFPVPRVMLDLQYSLLDTPEAITKLLMDTLAKCEHLTVVLGGDPAPDQRTILTTFYTDAELVKKIAQVRKMVDNLAAPAGKKVSVFGWVSKTHPAIDCVDVADLPALVNNTAGGLLLMNNMSMLSAAEKAAVEKILGWLQKDGINVGAMNKPGGPISWSEAVNA